MPSRRDEIKAAYEAISRVHAHDWNGNEMEIDLLRWLRSAAPDDERLIRGVLLDEVLAAPGHAYWIPLGALAQDASPEIAART